MQQNMFAIIIFKFNAPTNKLYAIYKNSISANCINNRIYFLTAQ